MLYNNRSRGKSAFSMGFFGTSKEEESQLRQAVLTTSETRQSYSSNTESSVYETADEMDSQVSPNIDITDHEKDNQGINTDETNNNHHTAATNVSPQGDDDSTVQGHEYSANPISDSNDDSDSSVPKNFSGIDGDNEEEEEEENRLNREYTIERIKSHKSLEAAAEEQIKEEESFIHPHSSSSTTFDKEKIYTVDELLYDGPDDKDNPHNWPKWKKWMITYTAAILCLVCSLGSSMYTGSVPEIMKRFGASQELCLAGLTFYLLGLAFGPALSGPLSEVFGRKPLYMFSLPIAMLFTMGVGLAKNIETILVLRFFCGFFSSPALAVASGTISDCWAINPAEQSFAVALFCLCPFLGPVLGPIIGGFAGEYKGWQWASAWVLLMFFGAVWPFTIILPETYKPIILARKAQKRGMKVEVPKLNIAFVKKVIKFNLFMPLKLLIEEPIVLVLSVYISFVFAVLFGFFEAFPVIFRGVHHMDLGISGLPFISVGIGLFLGVVTYVILDKTIFFPKNPDGSRGKRDADGNFIWGVPEKKLLNGKIGAPFLPIALFWLGWSGRSESIHWMAPTASGVFFGYGLILVFFSVVLYFSMSFPPIYVASAIAANNLLRYTLASVFPLFTVQCFENLGIGWAGSLFAFIALAMVPVPYVFGYFGPHLRARSKFGYAAYFKKLEEQKELQAAADAKKKNTNRTQEQSVNSSAVELEMSSESEKAVAEKV